MAKSVHILCTQADDLLASFLNHLIVSVPTCEHIYIYTQNTVEDRINIETFFKHNLFLTGHYLNASAIQVSFLTYEEYSLKLKTDQTQTTIVYSDAWIYDGDNVDLVLPEWTEELLDENLSFKDELTEQILKHHISALDKAKPMDLALLSKEIEGQIHTILKPEAPFEYSQNSLKFLMDIPVLEWIQIEDFRAPLNRLIRAQIEEATYFREYLLRIFQRVYLSKPSRWQQLPRDVQDFLLPYQHKGFLEILEPLTNFKVSILIFTYNRLDWLQHCVARVLEQTYTNWQLIIADHGSTDGTMAYTQKLAESRDNIIVWRYESNTYYDGISKILERFYTTVDTELVVCCTDDDWLLPNHLEETVAFAKQYPWVAAVGGQFNIVQSDRVSLISKYGPFYPQNTIMDNQKELQRCAMICPLGNELLGRKETYTRLAQYDPMFGGKEGRSKVMAWDYMNNVKLFSLFEVGYIVNQISAMRAETVTTSASRDNTYDFLIMLEEIINGYNRLFCSLYPHFPANYWLVSRMNDHTERMKQALILENHEKCRAQLESSITTGLKFNQVINWVKKNTAATTPLRINGNNPYV